MAEPQHHYHREHDRTRGNLGVVSHRVAEQIY